MTDDNQHTFRLDWRGIEIEIRYCPDWLPGFGRTYGHPLAHIEIETVTPYRAPLPVTQTGYRSHFTDPEEIEAAGGPVPFIRTMLDKAAQDPAWIEQEAAARQMSLF